jgi:hypothetical protein
MRDLFAGIVALALLIAAASLATTLRYFRRRRLAARASELAMGRRVIAELPRGDDLVLFSEDAGYFYYGDRAVDKELVAAVRVLINGSPIAAATSRRLAREAAEHPTRFDDRPEGIARDRWDVAIEAVTGLTLVECGAIRERVSQELARAIFDAIKSDIDRRNAA